jgi:hypothetical protein
MTLLRFGRESTLAAGSIKRGKQSPSSRIFIEKKETTLSILPGVVRGPSILQKNGE